jgi:hypothetical protein
MLCRLILTLACTTCQRPACSTAAARLRRSMVRIRWPMCRPGAVPPEVAARRREWAALEEALQQRLDPIDWATYEPYLAANVAAYLHRTETLLGSLLQLARPPAPEVSGRYMGFLWYS